MSSAAACSTASAFSRPTVNSYKRAVPYSFAATTATWGRDNRTTGLRVLGESQADTRIEHRLAGADANPYLVLAAHLAGGLHGVQADLEPPPPTGDAYGLPARVSPRRSHRRSILGESPDFGAEVMTS